MRRAASSQRSITPFSTAAKVTASVDAGEHERSIAAALERAEAHAPFLAWLVGREPEVVRALQAPFFPSLDIIRATDAPLVAQRLRIERRRLALLVAIGDLSGTLDLSAVTRALTGFADYALDAAIRAAIAERTPDAEPVGFAAIALGKQGSGELNYSSDIDPILMFDPARLPCRPREEPGEAAVRIGRRVIELLQARDGDGYVLRVDLRLRPSPEVTPIAIPVGAAVTYYESMALPWERAAFIRARAAAGDLELGAQFLETIRPFIWRRAVDFGAIGEIRAMSRRIRDHYAQGQGLGPGYDLKRGRGGIREIEFFAQIHQLIHGGRDVDLRVPATRDALKALAGAGIIDGDDATMLCDAYTLYRTIEHRLQMVDDRQTHSLPIGAALDGVARLHGLAGGSALIDLLRPSVERVGTLYDALEPETDLTLPMDSARLGAMLVEQGFTDPSGAVRLIEAWRAGAYPAVRSAAARQALEAVLPALIEALGRAPRPQAAIANLDRIFASLPSAINFFRLLEAQPPLARLLGLILSHAPPLAEALGRRHELFDGLIDASALDAMPSVDALAQEMTVREEGGDYQAQLDHVRHVVGERRFALGAQIIAGVSDPLAVAQGYARVAEAAIDVLARATVDDFTRRHGRVPNSELVVLALGRLGGGALTHASDLDLIYLFTGDYAAESDGEKPLGAVLYYNRLAQRLTAALSVPTAAGPLYEIDTRLRPSGAQGPLVVSTEGFARYQREDAWTWEHMALTRARPVFGSADARAEVCAIITEVLRGARPDRDIVADAAKMRADMARHKAPAGPLDAKLLPGGMVDLEFTVHVLQLVHRTGFDADLGRAIDLLAGQGLIPGDLRSGYELLMRLLVVVRLVAPDAQPPSPATRTLIARALDMPDWEAVIASFDAVRQEIAACWAQVATKGNQA